MRRRSCVSLASVVSVLGFFAVAACSPAPISSGFSRSEKDVKTDSPGTFGNGADDADKAAAKGECIPTKGNYEIPGDDCDNDDDGTVDNAVTCDAALTSGASAEDFAKSLGICDTAANRGFGLVSARFTRGYNREDAPMAEQHGVLEKFGNVLKPREGKRLGVLSTGYAQEYNGAPGVAFGGDEGGKSWFNARSGQPGNGTAPPGFPKAAAGCPGETNVNDVSNVHLELKAPKNASGFRFDFNFHSGEWPAYICSKFNDGFVAYLTASGKAENISFDPMKNPVSVNNGFFDRCTPNVDTGCADGAKPATSQCPGGTAELKGTGYGAEGKWCELPGGDGTGPNGPKKVSTAGGATGWLTSSAPVVAGEEFTLDFMIWDTGDGVLDSSVLLDNFKWAEGEVTVVTDRPR